MKTLQCMMKTINHEMKTIHSKMKTLLPTQNEDDALKYKVKEATFLSFHLKTKITATEALEGNIFYSWGK